MTDRLTIATAAMQAIITSARPYAGGLGGQIRDLDSEEISDIAIAALRVADALIKADLDVVPDYTKGSINLPAA